MKKIVFPAAFAVAVVSAFAFTSSKTVDTQYYRIISGGNPVCDLSNCQPTGSAPCDHTTFAVQPSNPNEECSEQVLNLKKP